jgi:hypothetical protein
MDLREVRFWTVEAARANDLEEASMAEATRMAYHADRDVFADYIRRLKSRPLILRPTSTKEQDDNWERMKKRRRG